MENHIENVSSDDKAAYMRILQSLVARLSDVENRGYTPPTHNVRLMNNTIIAIDNGDGDSQIAPSAISSSTNRNARQKKKRQQQKNTKPHALTATVTSKQLESKSTHSASDDEDLTDPVAVALLGMGFTKDQIKSAAWALGGFERATADDMVVWILGRGGEIIGSASSPNQGNNSGQKSTKIDAFLEAEKADAAILGKAQKKAAARTKRDSEEAARKRQDELAAAKRAADKREEQRRIRREWNEREQARQDLEKNARIAEALERRKQSEMEKLLPQTALFPAVLIATVSRGVGVPPSAVAGGGGGKHHHRNTDSNGPPLTIIAGGPKVSSSKSKTATSNMGIPQAPTVRAPKILTRPSKTPQVMLTGATGSVHSQQTMMGAGNQPPFTPASSSSPRPASSPPRSILTKTFNPSTSQHPSGVHQRQNPPTAILQKTNNAGGPHQNVESSRKGEHNASTASMVNASTPLFQNPSFGTGTSVAPPGFLTGSSPPEQSATDSASPSYVDANPLGMIRATAREFVPSSFKQTIPHVAPNTAASMSAQSMHAPFVTVSPSASNDHSDNLRSDHMSSLVSSFGDDRNAHPATLVPIVGSKGDFTVPSAASSITGVSGMPTAAEENAASRVGSIMTFESIPSSVDAGAVGGITTSSILESISYGAGQNSSTALGSGGIWGGRNNVNQTASLGLAGLNLSSFLGEGDTLNNTNEGNHVAGGSTDWGTNIGRGSIW